MSTTTTTTTGGGPSWTCGVCTYLNAMSSIRCGMCDSDRPAMRHKAEQRIPINAQSSRPEGPSLKNDFELWYAAPTILSLSIIS
jgi:hypothetical protein